MSLTIKDLDFRFENSLAKIVANRNQAEIKLAGLAVGPFEEGNEYEIHYWIAKKLVEAGIVHFREDFCLSASDIYKAQWKERVQVAGQIAELQEDFYPKLRRYIAQLKKEVLKQPEKMQEYEKAKQLGRDISNSRLKKIVALSSGPSQADQVVKKMTAEERLVYEKLAKIVDEWRNNIQEYEVKT
ncbi:TPA: DNA replication complex GINS family protein [Candidatus Bathyarchaeota archaeon]|nr:DNA replication complex GINS family protein [Candidatus Bathyarchaeota archaeon]